MSRFSSRRERRLWMWTLAVLVALFSTLGLARTLADAMGESDVGTGLFILGCLMVLAAVVTQGLKRRPSGLEIGVILGVAAVYMLVFTRMAVPTERSHLIEYGVVSVLIYEALLERAANGYRVPVPALLATFVTSMIGLIDEGVQWFVPGRVLDPYDMLFNVFAAVMAISAVTALRWVRQRDWRGATKGPRGYKSPE